MSHICGLHEIKNCQISKGSGSWRKINVWQNTSGCPNIPEDPGLFTTDTHAETDTAPPSLRRSRW